MDSRIDVIIDIRGFNRFYTNMLGLLNANIGSSDYSLTETRIIYEISKTEKCSANQLSNILRIDTGYLSRILKKLEKEGVPAEFILIDGVDHADAAFSQTEVKNLILDYLNRTLK